MELDIDVSDSVDKLALLETATEQSRCLCGCVDVSENVIKEVMAEGTLVDSAIEDIVSFHVP